MFLAILLVNWNEKIRTDLLPISNLDFAILNCVMRKILFLPTKSPPGAGKRRVCHHFSNMCHRQVVLDVKA